MLEERRSVRERKQEGHDGSGATMFAGGVKLWLDFQRCSNRSTPVLCCRSIVLRADNQRPFVTRLFECVAGKSCGNQLFSTIFFW